MNDNNNGIVFENKPVEGMASVVNPTTNTVVSNNSTVIAPEAVPNVVSSNNNVESFNNGVITPTVGTIPSSSDVVVPNIAVTTEPITPQANEIISVSPQGVTPDTNLNATGVPAQENGNILSFDLPSSNGINTGDQNVNSNEPQMNTAGNIDANVATNVGDASQVISPVASTTIEQATVDNNSIPTNDAVVSVGKYLGYMFLFSIPVVGFIMLIVKALDKKDKNISNFAKAQLLYGVLISVIVTVFVFISFATLVSVINNIAGNNVQSGNSNNYSEMTSGYYDVNNYADDVINSDSISNDTGDISVDNESN